jgi:hypothetical protein
MTSELEEVRELHELNVELLDTLLVVGQCFIEDIDRYGVKVEGREKLAALIGKAICLLERISMPYRGNPMRPLTKRSDDSPLDNAIKCLGEGVPLASKFMRKIVERHLLVW